MFKKSEVIFEEKLNAPYRFHATLTYLPTGMEIEQASENSMAEAKEYCMKELRWRLKNWGNYDRSAVCKDFSL